jgi:hypothetical protein
MFFGYIQKHGIAITVKPRFEPGSSVSLADAMTTPQGPVHTFISISHPDTCTAGPTAFTTTTMVL